jgi:hypothetical protein
MKKQASTSWGPRFAPYIHGMNKLKLIMVIMTIVALMPACYPNKAINGNKCPVFRK